MHEGGFLYAALLVFGLLTLATLVHSVTKRLHIPFAVGLLLAGLLLSLGLQSVMGMRVEYLQFSPEIIFYVFLPTLIFESAYHIKFRQFRGVLREVSLLATLGVALSAGIVAAACHFLLGLPLGVALLFGVLISATDPVAVLAIFKELKVPKKLVTIVDGESLINDGTALVAFQFLFKFVVLGVAITFTPWSVGYELWNLVQSIALGILVGIVFGGVLRARLPKVVIVACS